MSYKIGAVSSGRIDADAITSAKIADDAVTADHVASNAITSAEILADAVTQAKVADDAIGADQLASSAVVTASLVDNCVTAAKLADNITYGSTLTISGDLIVQGDTITANVGTMTVEDHNITLGSGNSGSAVADATGLTLEGGSGDDITFAYLASGDKMELKKGSAYADFKAGTIEGALSGNASTATALATARTISLAGDLSGSASFDGSANVSISATVAANSVALGTDTTGNYMAGISGSGAGVTVSHTAGEGSSATVALHASLQDVAGLSHADGAFIVSDGSNFTVESGATARSSLGLGSAALSASSDFYAASSVSTFGGTLIDDADAAAARTTLGLAIGSDVQAYDAQLASLSNLSNPSSGDTFVTMNPGGFANNMKIGDFSNASSSVIRESVGGDDSASSSVSVSTYTAFYKIEMNNRSSCTVSLPAITSDDTGKRMVIKAGSTVSSSKPFTLQGSSSQTIDGGTVTMNEQYSAVTCVAMADGAGYGWFIV